MLPAKYVLWLQNIIQEDTPLVGLDSGKLGEMIASGIPISSGFVITTKAYTDFLHENNLVTKIQHIIGSTQFTDAQSINKAKKNIRKNIEDGNISEVLVNDIFHAYSLLSGVLTNASIKMSISFVQQPQIKLGTIIAQGETNLLLQLKNLWSDILLQSIEDGVLHPKHGAIVIQACPKVPVTYALSTTSLQDKNALEITFKDKKYLIDKNSFDSLPHMPSGTLTFTQLHDIGRIAKQIENYFYFPQEVQLGFQNNKLIILDIKHPETVINSKSIQDNIKTENHIQPTATKVFVTLLQPDLAVEASKCYVDGVGLLRADSFIREIGIHPKQMIHNGKKRAYEELLAEKIAAACKVFSPRPIMYRTSDFMTNDYRALEGGEQYEPVEINPMFGFRGTFRYLYDPELFSLELEAIKLVRNTMQLKNLWLALPFVRTVSELTKIKKIITDAGLYRSTSFKLFMVAEVPSNVILLDKFIEAGIDGVTIGINDLTMLTLGIDPRNSEIAQKQYYEDEAVLWSIEKIIKTAKKYKIISSFCGQDVHSYPELLEKLVTWGVSNISVSRDAIDTTRNLISQIENKLVNQL